MAIVTYLQVCLLAYILGPSVYKSACQEAAQKLSVLRAGGMLLAVRGAAFSQALTG